MKGEKKPAMEIEKKGSAASPLRQVPGLLAF
jgi:hypothetical protein